VSKVEVSVSRERVARVTQFTIEMATAGTGGGMRSPVLHTGAGVARREAHHERRSEDRAVLEEVDLQAALRTETAMQTIVRVEAGSIVVEAEGANYVPAVKREGKKERRARQQEQAREQQREQAEAAAEPTGGTAAVAEDTTEADSVKK
jgi:hypothetical protein